MAALWKDLLWATTGPTAAWSVLLVSSVVQCFACTYGMMYVTLVMLQPGQSHWVMGSLQTFLWRLQVGLVCCILLLSIYVGSLTFVAVTVWVKGLVLETVRQVRFAHANRTCCVTVVFVTVVMCSHSTFKRHFSIVLGFSKWSVLVMSGAAFLCRSQLEKSFLNFDFDSHACTAPQDCEPHDAAHRLPYVRQHCLCNDFPQPFLHILCLWGWRCNRLGRPDLPSRWRALPASDSFQCSQPLGRARHLRSC